MKTKLEDANAHRGKIVLMRNALEDRLQFARVDGVANELITQNESMMLRVPFGYFYSVVRDEQQQDKLINFDNMHFVSMILAIPIISLYPSIRIIS